jgi:hypothetical protein
MSSPFQIQPFSFVLSIQLLLITFFIGIVCGGFIEFARKTTPF